MEINFTLQKSFCLMLEAKIEKLFVEFDRNQEEENSKEIRNVLE